MAERIVRRKVEALQINDIVQWGGPIEPKVRGPIGEIKPEAHGGVTIRLKPPGNGSRTLLPGDHIDVVVDD